MEKTLQIAIVHQNAETRHRLHVAVAQLGHSVCVHAGTGRELVDSSQRPELIIVQEYLPDMTGLQAVNKACGDESIPIVIIIDPNDGELLDQPDSANVLAVLQEPVSSSDLIPVIPMVIQRAEQLQELRNRVQALRRELGDSPRQ